MNEFDSVARERARRRRARDRRRMLRMQRMLVVSVVALAAVMTVEAFTVDETTTTPPLPEIPTEVQEVEIPEVVEEVTVAEIATVAAAAEQDELPLIENVTMTHYCICKKCCGKDPDHPAYGITASGRVAEPYVSVAVDPDVIPLGSTVYVDYGDGEIHEYRADDTGSGVDGAHLDLCVSDHEEGRRLGVKTVKVWYE